MKRLSLLMILLLVSNVFAVTPNPGHDASRIGPGAFPAGNFTFSDNVGVGTTSPNAGSHPVAITVGTSSNYSALEFRRSGTTGNGAEIGRITTWNTNFNEGHEQNAYISFIAEGATNNQRGGAITFTTKPNAGTSLTERLRIDQAGNVGIGTQSPSYKLDIVGNTRINGTGSGAAARLYFGDGGGNAGMRSYGVGINEQNYGDFIIYQSASQGADPFAGTARLIITPAGNVNVTGTLYTPQLCLNGDCQTSWPEGAGASIAAGWTNTTTQVSLSDASDNVSAGALFIDNTNTRVGIAGPATYPLTVKLGANQNLGVRDLGGVTNIVVINDALNAAQPLSFTTAETTFSNNVGVGTSDAQTTLDVLGTDTLPVYVRTSDTTAHIRFLTGSTVSRGAFGYDSSGAQFLNSSLSGTNMVILDGGNVGIGTSSPVGNLQVRGTAGTGIAYFTTSDFNHNTNTGSTLEIVQGAATGNTYSELRALSAGYSTWNNLVLQTGGGNVGIGTTGPTTKLHVHGGPIRVNDTATGAISVGGDTGVMRMQTDGTFIRFLSASNTYAPVKAGSYYVGDTAVIDGSRNIVNAGSATFGSSISVPATSRVYLDGGSNTYIHEPSADVIELVRGGSIGATIDSAGVKAQGNIYVGQAASNDDDYIFMDAGAESIRWEEANTWFEFSDKIRLSDEVQATRLLDNDNTAYYVDPAGATSANFAGSITATTLNTGQGNYELYAMNQNVQTTDAVTFGSLDVNGAITRTNTRVDSGQDYPVGHYSYGETVFEVDPTWSQAELQEFFGSSAVSWVTDATAPGGYAIYVDGAVNVGGVYGSGFPYIPVDQDDIYYMEVWIRNAGTNQQHYMGSIDYNGSFASLGGNPGSYGYWVMSASNPGSSWTKYTGYITGFGTSTGQFVSGTKYWTPQALFNYGAGTGTRAAYISGWKVIKVSHPGNRYFSGDVGIGDSTPNAKLDVEGTARFDYSGGYTVIQDASGVSVFNPEGTTGEVRLGAAWEQPGVYAQSNLYLGTSGTKVQFGTNGAEAAYVDTSGNAQFDGDVTVSGGDLYVGDERLYDSGSYLAMADWLQIDGVTGLYWPSTGLHTGSPHFYPGDLGDYGTFRIHGTRNSWSGLSLAGRYVLMTDEDNEVGLYNDVNDEWMIYAVQNGGLYLYYDGATRLETTSTGAAVTGALTVTGSTSPIVTIQAPNGSPWALALGRTDLGTNSKVFYHNPGAGAAWVFEHNPYIYNGGSYNAVWHSGNDGSGSGLDADTWDGQQFASYLDQAVLTTSNPTFAQVHATDWFRNNVAGEGIYNTATGKHFYSESTSYWTMDSANGMVLRNGHAGTITGYLYWDGTAGSNNFGLLSPSGNWRVRVSNSDVETTGTNVIVTVG